MKRFNSISTLSIALFLYGTIFTPIQSITPGKWSYKDAYILYPKDQKYYPKEERVFDAKGKLVLTSNIRFKDGMLFEEKYLSNGIVEGTTEYKFDSSNRITKEITKDSKSNPTETIEYVYKGSQISKIRIFNEDGKLYMNANVYKWDGDLIESGDITWTDTKDKEKIRTEDIGKNKKMSILDEKNQPIAYVTYLYNDKMQIIERQFIQGNNNRKNLFEYDNQNRLVQFSFHVKQEGKWVLEKTHKLSY